MKMNPMQAPNVGVGGKDHGNRERVEPDADRFRVDDVWENSRGTPHRVVSVKMGGKAKLQNLRTGNFVTRAWDDLGWKAGRPWIRVSCGA